MKVMNSTYVVVLKLFKDAILILSKFKQYVAKNEYRYCNIMRDVLFTYKYIFVV